MTSVRNYQEKLEMIAKAEKSGAMKNATINSFRADCPFCGTPLVMFVTLRSRKNTASYSCNTCGEGGNLGDLEVDVKKYQDRQAEGKSL